MEEPGRLQSMGSLWVRHDWATSLSRIGEGNGNPLQCSCLENPSLVGSFYGVARSWTWLKWLSNSSSSSPSSSSIFFNDSETFCFMHANSLQTQMRKDGHQTVLGEQGLNQTYGRREEDCRGMGPAGPVFAWVLSCFSRVWLFATLCTVARQAPLSMGFSRQEYWSGLPCSSPGGSSQPRDHTCISCIGR